MRRLISYELSIEREHKRTAIEEKLIVKCNKREQKTKKNDNNNSNTGEQSKKYKSHRVLNLDNCEVEMASQSSSTITESQVSFFPANLFGTTINRMSLPGIHVRTEKDQLKSFIIQKVRDYMGDVYGYEASIVNYISNAFKTISERPSFAARSKATHHAKS